MKQSSAAKEVPVPAHVRRPAKHAGLKYARIPGTDDEPKSYLEYKEYIFKTRECENNYRVTLSVISIPSKGVFYVGAEACAPEDEFFRQEVGRIALDRARQAAFRMTIGKKGFGKMLVDTNDCIQHFEMTTWQSTPEFIRNAIERRIESIYERVALNAERRAAEKAVAKLQRKDPKFGITMNDAPNSK